MDKLSTNLPPNENTFGDITQCSGETTLGVMYEKLDSSTLHRHKKIEATLGI